MSQTKNNPPVAQLQRRPFAGCLDVFLLGIDTPSISLGIGYLSKTAPIRFGGNLIWVSSVAPKRPVERQDHHRPRHLTEPPRR